MVNKNVYEIVRKPRQTVGRIMHRDISQRAELRDAFFRKLTAVVTAPVKKVETCGVARSIEWDILARIRLRKYIRNNIAIDIPEAAAGYLREGLQTEWRRIHARNSAISTPFHPRISFYPLGRPVYFRSIFQRIEL